VEDNLMNEDVDKESLIKNLTDDELERLFEEEESELAHDSEECIEIDTLLEFNKLAKGNEFIRYQV
jgi:hypothetical protein